MTRMKTECKLKVPPAFDGNHLYVGHLNIRSLNKHYCDIISDPAIQQIAVICLTETRVKKTPKETFVPGYEMVLNNKNHGLAIFVKQNLRYRILDFKDSGIEILGIALQFDQVTYHIVVAYKPPSFPVQVFLQHIHSHIRTLRDFILLGDLNQTGNTEIFDHFLQKNGLFQYIRTPTHSLGDTLDLIISRIPNLQTFTKPVPYTDHHFIAVKLTDMQSE